MSSETTPTLAYGLSDASLLFIGKGLHSHYGQTCGFALPNESSRDSTPIPNDVLITLAKKSLELTNGTPYLHGARSHGGEWKVGPVPDGDDDIDVGTILWLRDTAERSAKDREFGLPLGKVLRKHAQNFRANAQKSDESASVQTRSSQKTVYDTKLGSSDASATQ